MRTQSICLALAVVLVCRDASAQWKQTNEPFTCDSNATVDHKKSYAIRVGLDDIEQDVEFYGIGIAAIQNNDNSLFSGLTINGTLGDPEFGQILRLPQSCISVSGINASLWSCSVGGTVNGISTGGLYVHNATNVNGIAFALLGANTSCLNGVALAVLDLTESGNGLQAAFIGNLFQTFNGLVVAAINYGKEYNSAVFGTENYPAVFGMVIGLANLNANVRGLSLGVINGGDSWVQIGLLNGGNGPKRKGGDSWLQVGLLNGGHSLIQIGLLNFDGNNALRFPFINVNL
jgi:hypothetical protein